jgi:hypothetical protein
MSAPTYEIKEVRDFSKIPIERMSDCLEEFAQWIALLKTFELLADTLPADQREAMALQSAQFVWIDDDRKDITIRVSSEDGTIQEEIKLT